jgi:DNA-binding MarR family transcriptional regulator
MADGLAAPRHPDIASILCELWLVQQDVRLFRDRNRDWIWLLYVWAREKGGKEVTVSDVGGVLGVSYPTAKRIVKSVEDLGYVRIEKDTSDRRRTVIRLSGQGRAELQAYEAVASEIIGKYA